MRRVGSGFTLVEVLVALVVLAVALGALIKAGGEHARNTGILTERALAGWVAENVVADYAAGLRATSGRSERFEERLGGRDWVVEVNPGVMSVDAPLPLPEILRIEVIVRDADDREQFRTATYATP